MRPTKSDWKSFETWKQGAFTSYFFWSVKLRYSRLRSSLSSPHTPPNSGLRNSDSYTMTRFSVDFLILAPLLAVAIPYSGRQSITSLSQSQIDFFTPYSYYASAAYCNPSTTLNWSCGTNCNANPGFKPIASGGDGSDVQYCK
jgi:hypothetical protein